MRKIILLLVVLAIIVVVWIFTPYSFEVYKLIAGNNFTETYFSDEFLEGESFVIKNDKDLKKLLLTIEDENFELIVQDNNIFYVLLDDKWYRTEDKQDVLIDLAKVIDTEELLDSSNYVFDANEKKFVLTSDADIEFMGTKVNSISYKNYFYKIVFEIHITEVIDNGGTVQVEDTNITLTLDNFFMTKIELPSDYEDLDDLINS